VPQYGGTLTVIPAPQWTCFDPGSPDIADGYAEPPFYLGVFQETPFVGDFETYGPRGTGEYTFQADSYIPDRCLTGEYVEGWEVDTEKVTWYIRPGIYWAPTEDQIARGVMDGPRELTADDVAADLIYERAAPGGKMWRDIMGDIYATDRYTVVLEFAKADIFWSYLIGYEDRTVVSPIETEGLKDWEDQVGSGPYMMEEYVVGSHFKYVRNPDYWKTVTIDGVEYETPFIDEIIWPIVPDESTRIAALRTGTIDWLRGMNPIYFNTLEGTPDLILDLFYSGNANGIALKCSEPPFDDVAVRQAMMIGTDIQAFVDLYGAGPQPKHWFPHFPENHDVSTPYEDLPAGLQELYDYDPEEARQLLDEAGIPNPLEIDFYCSTDPEDVDAAALLQNLWAKIGVDISIKANDTTTTRALTESRAYTGAALWGFSMTNPVNALWRSGKWDYYLCSADWKNDDFEELLVGIGAEFTDIDGRNSMCKEAGSIEFSEVPYIPTTLEVQGVAWWPWLKNYYGEVTVGDYAKFAPFMAIAWIDEDLKEEMGY